MSVTYVVLQYQAVIQSQCQPVDNKWKEVRQGTMSEIQNISVGIMI